MSGCRGVVGCMPRLGCSPEVPVTAAVWGWAAASVAGLYLQPRLFCSPLGI